MCIRDRPHGVARLLKRAPKQRQELWNKLGIEPRAIDREIATIMHSTHIGCTGDIDSLMQMSLRTALADGWVGSMIGTIFSDILFGTPTVRNSEANLGVLEENKVNIILHGHEPSLLSLIHIYLNY